MRTVVAVLVIGIAVVAPAILVIRPFASGPEGQASPFSSASPIPSASGPGSSPSPSPSSSPSAAPTPPGRLLPAGSFSSTGVVPGVNATVPAGWTLQLDSRDLLILVRPNPGWVRQTDGLVIFDSVSIYARPSAGQADGSRQPVAGVGNGPQELATWLSERPQLVATEPVRSTLAGRTAYRIDFHLSTQAGELCGMPCANLLNGPTVTSYAFGIVGQQRERAYLLQAPNGDTMMVCVEDADGSGVEPEAAAAAGILDSLAFQR
jgi:hypothetical protein